MSKNASQSHRHASTHYHDAARQHQDTAHLTTSATTRQQQAPRKSTNSRRASQTKR